MKLKKMLIVGAVIASLFSTGVSAETLINSVNFESGVGDWVNDRTGIDSHDFTLNSGSTPSSYTGPASGDRGSPQYLYLETSTGGANIAGNSAILVSPVFDEVHRFKLAAHLYGKNIGRLSIDLFDGSRWRNDWTYREGEFQTPSNNDYLYIDLDLSGYIVKQVRIRATAVGGWQGDIAIDSIEVYGPGIDPVPPVFASNPVVITDAVIGYEYFADLSDVVSDANSDQLTFTKISGPDWLVMSSRGDISGTPDDPSAQQFVLNVFVSDGVFDVEGVVHINVSNELVLFQENFESQYLMWTSEFDTNAQADKFRRHSSNTPSSNTGPSGASNGTYYGYLETSSQTTAYSAGAVSILESPIIGSTDNTIALSFDYHMFGSTMGELKIDVLDNGYWFEVDEIRGQQQTTTTESYINHKVNFHGYNVEKIRFRVISAGGWQGDLALDNIIITSSNYIGD